MSHRAAQEAICITPGEKPQCCFVNYQRVHSEDYTDAWGWSPTLKIPHASGVLTLGQLFRWSFNFTLAFLGNPERKKHLLPKSGWFYPC